MDVFCEMLMLLGLMSSTLIVCGVHRSVLFVVVWISYLSLFLVGQAFLGFQWDILLIEVGFLCIIKSVFYHLLHVHDNFMSWCFRFVIFKLMFMSGVVKLQAGCPTWINLTALEYHFATQPLPNLLSWYAHQLHPALLRAGVAMTLFIEIPATLLLIMPFTLTRILGANLQIFLQLIIILTGNYNFFNLLTILLTIPCFSSDFGKLWQSKWTDIGFSLLQLVVVVGFCLLECRRMFSLEFDNPFSLDSMSTVVHFLDGMFLKVNDAYMTALNDIIPSYSIFAFGFVLAMIVFVFLNDIRCTITKKCNRVLVTKEILLMIIAAAVSVVYIFISFQSFESIGVRSTSVPQYVRDLHRTLSPFHVTSGYGLFRQMTGVGKVNNVKKAKLLGRQLPSVVARPEIVMEGVGVDGVWHEIHFRYKPTSLSQVPNQVAPHQPRLDWHMWFAALANYQHHPWIINLADKLLQGNCTEVVDLLDMELFPFKNQTLFGIKATLYDYDFTRWNSPWNQNIPESKIVASPEEQGWWHRRNPREYLPGLEPNNKSVKDFLKTNGLHIRPCLPKADIILDCVNHLTEKNWDQSISDKFCNSIYEVRNIITPHASRTMVSVGMIALAAILLTIPN